MERIENTPERVQCATYNTKQVAAALGIGTNKALALMRSEGFPSFRLGNTYLIERTAFEKWLTSVKNTTFWL